MKSSLNYPWSLQFLVSMKQNPETYLLPPKKPYHIKTPLSSPGPRSTQLKLSEFFEGQTFSKAGISQTTHIQGRPSSITVTPSQSKETSRKQTPTTTQDPPICLSAKVTQNCKVSFVLSRGLQLEMLTQKLWCMFRDWGRCSSSRRTSSSAPGLCSLMLTKARPVSQVMPRRSLEKPRRAVWLLGTTMSQDMET